MTATKRAGSAAVALVGICTGTAGADHVFILKKAGTDVAIERVAVGPGETREFACSAESGIIDVILPVGIGGSGSLSRLSDESTIVVTNDRGTLHLTSRGADGKEWTRPARALKELRSQDIRVSVSGQDGTRRALLIKGYETVQDEPVGPVIDMFAGRIPLRASDYVVCTDTYEPLHTPRTYGEARLEHDRYLFVHGKLSDGTGGDFILDVGAGQSVVSRAFLPKGTPIEESSMVQYSSAGKEILKYEPGGATGKTQSVLGVATLDELTMGSISFRNAVVAVLDMPDLFGRPVAGILGLDLLRRAEVVTLEYGDDGGGKLALSSMSRLEGDRSTEIPMATVNSHLAVRGEVNGVSTAFIVDTGAPGVFLDLVAARLAGVHSDTKGVRDVHGLDEGSAQASPAVIHELRVGGVTFTDHAAHISALPIFAPLHMHDQAVGLLGNSLFSKFALIEFDLVGHVARFERK